MAAPGPGISRANQNRAIRRQAMLEQLSVHGHYQQFNQAIEKMVGLAGEEIIDQQVKDRFAMLAAIADKQWRVVEKYLPAQVIQEGQDADSNSPAGGVSRVALAVERLLATRLAGNGQGAVPDGSLVPAPVRLPPE